MEPPFVEFAVDTSDSVAVDAESGADNADAGENAAVGNGLAYSQLDCQSLETAIEELAAAASLQKEYRQF